MFKIVFKFKINVNYNYITPAPNCLGLCITILKGIHNINTYIKHCIMSSRLQIAKLHSKYRGHLKTYNFGRNILNITVPLD